MKLDVSFAQTPSHRLITQYSIVVMMVIISLSFDNTACNHKIVISLSYDLEQNSIKKM